MADKQYVWLSQVFELHAWLQHKDASFSCQRPNCCVSNQPQRSSELQPFCSTRLHYSTTTLVQNWLSNTHLVRCVLDNQFWQDQTLKNPRHSSFSCSRDVRTMHAPSENGWNLNKTPQTQTQYISIQEENTGRTADLMNVKLNIYRMCSFCPAANQNEDASLCQRCKMSRPISRRSTEKNPSNILFLGPQTNTFWETRDGVQEAGF